MQKKAAGKLPPERLIRYQICANFLITGGKTWLDRDGFLSLDIWKINIFNDKTTIGCLFRQNKLSEYFDK